MECRARARAVSWRHRSLPMPGLRSSNTPVAKLSSSALRSNPADCLYYAPGSLGGCLSRSKPPPHLARRFTQLSPAHTETLAASLQVNYFPRKIWGEAALSGEQWLATPEGQRDPDEHISPRLH